MKKQSFQKVSKLAFRMVWRISLLVGILAFIVGFFFFEKTANTVLLSILLLVGTFLGAYGIIYRILFKRFAMVNRINRNIAHKRFEDYQRVRPQNRDELDSLIQQTKQASKTVEREIERLNRIENYRKEFIGDISHELKTPIFAIQGFTETLLNGAIDDEEVNHRFLEKTMRNVNRLTYLTKDLIEISKLETGELKSEIREVDLDRVINEIVESLQYNAEKGGVFVQVKSIDENLPVRADRNQVKQVLINLIENGIKYNKTGGLVTVGVKPFPEDEHRILVYVKDTGIGIEPQYVERITERFFRVDKSRSREKGGTGLGLAIVKHIMEAHGEEFFVESTPNKGSTFSFTLTKVEHSSVSD